MLIFKYDEINEFWRDHFRALISHVLKIVRTRVGHGSSPPTGRVGSGRVGSQKFSVLIGSGWVGSNVKKSIKCAINICKKPIIRPL